MSQVLLEVTNLSKTFPGVKALTAVNISVNAGEVVALLGHNGSGKSTLVKILAGVYAPDPGGEIRCPDSSAAQRLHFIHQDLGLIGQLTAIENLDLSRKLRTSAVLPTPRRQERANAREFINQFGVDFDVDTPVAQLTPADRTIVVIARALADWSTDDNILVLDEPTAALHGREADKLFDVVRQVASRGAGIIYISHRLEEVVELADRAVVLKNGEVVATRNRGEFDHDALVALIAGTEPDSARAKPERANSAIRLQVRAMAGPAVQDVSFEVRSGEIVGIAGLVGSGVEQVCSMVFGTAPRTAGSVEIDGTQLRANAPTAAIKAGVGFVPADRRRFGAVVSMTARENLTLPRLRPVTNWAGSVSRRTETRAAEAWMRKVDVRPAQPERPFALFSGGNQQKIVMAKWLRNEPQVLLLDEPTQGVDVGAKAAIYGLLAEAAESGTAVLVASSDSKELAELCDRVVVLQDGTQVGELQGVELSESALVRCIVGSTSAIPSAYQSKNDPVRSST